MAQVDTSCFICQIAVHVAYSGYQEKIIFIINAIKIVKLNVIIKSRIGDIEIMHNHIVHYNFNKVK